MAAGPNGGSIPVRSTGMRGPDTPRAVRSTGFEQLGSGGHGSRHAGMTSHAWGNIWAVIGRSACWEDGVYVVHGIKFARSIVSVEAKFPAK